MCKVLSYRASRRFSTILLGSLFCASAAFAEVVTEPLAGHPEWGYTVSGLGESGDETAVVFTNHTETATWTVPTDLTDVQFLVVGGGGGAGSGTSGPGGGGGGVVTGLIYSVSKNSEVTIKVGGGGAGATGNVKAGSTGTNSSFSVNSVLYVTAKGGGRGTTGAGGQGGSGGGGRSGNSGGSATKGTIGEGASTYLYDVELFGNDGGSSYKSGNNSAAGGGGGATEAGGNATSAKLCGNGGEGLACDITGVSKTYGSGGGGGTSTSGGTAGKGGTGAGNGHSNKNAVANQGGGGGGGSSYANAGGAGGSGIVVFRYKVAGNVAVVPTFESKVYTGETLTADVADGTGYTVTQNDGGIDVGDYDVVLTLVDGYTWDVGEFSGTLTFSITQAANVWTVEPAISKDSWTQGVDEPGVLTAGETQFGTVAATITKDGGEATTFDGTLPTEAGEYIITYATAATANYTAPEVTDKTVSFAIYAADEIPPYTFATGTLSVNGERTLSVPYSIACDVTTTKAADIYVRYALDGDETTNTVMIASAVALNGGAGTGTIADLKPDATYWVDAYAVVDEVQSDATALDSVKVPGSATDFTASATFTNDPKVFTISGSVTPGLGTTTVTVEWSLNSDALDNSETFTFSYGDEGAFSKTVPYTELSDLLVWRVSVANTVTTGTWGEQSWSDATEAATKTRTDRAAVTYTWTGAGGDNLWTNVANWTASRADNFGYPNSTYATAHFATAGAVADLDGNSLCLAHDGLTFAGNLGKIVLRNGTITLNSSGKDLSFGASGTTVVFDTVRLTGFRCLTFTANAPVVFSGTTTQSWWYMPWGGNNTHFEVRDGEMSSGLFQVWTNSERVHYATISNATWTVGTSNIGKLIPGYWTYYYDGEDRQAQIISQGAIRLANRHTIHIPSGGHTAATLVAPTLDTESSSCTFRFDVTDFASGKKVPVVRFTGANQTSAVESMTLTVAAYADGEDVTEKRNARLVWSEEDNTLYYQQDSKSGFVVIIQ